MPKTKETEKIVETETKPVHSDSAVETVLVPPAVTEVLDKVRKDAAGRKSSIFEEPKEVGEIKETKPEGEKPEGIKEAAKAEDKAKGEEPEAKPQEYLEEIDPQLVDAAHAAGWSDDEIEKVAGENWDLFTRTFTPKVKPTEKEVPTLSVGDTKPLSKINLNSDTLQKWTDTYGQDAVDSAIKPLAETLNATIDQLAEVRAGLGMVQGRFTEQDRQTEGQRQTAKLQDANRVFDEESKNYPELGTTEKLPMTDGRVITSSAEFKTRSEIYGIAEVFRATGVSWPTSLKEAMTWYAGKVGEKRAEQRIITDINRDKKRWVARPDQKKVEREFATPEEAKKAIIKEAKEKAGYVA